MNLPTPIIAGNWKLNHGPAATRDYFDTFLKEFPASESGTVVVCPPAISLTTAVHALEGRGDVLLGVQNIYWEADGAYTGETSAPLAREAGARVVLVGHSERRHVFGETNEESAKKVRSALDAGMIAVLCVGETLTERESGRAFDMVERQLEVGARPVLPADLDCFLIAYEPVWAIGTGRTASPADASEMHAKIRGWLEHEFEAPGASIPILYGGSVKPENAAALLAASAVDGLLIGGASLDPVAFAAICALRP
jgi:triosephosphate isomerase (TIM)